MGFFLFHGKLGNVMGFFLFHGKLGNVMGFFSVCLQKKFFYSKNILICNDIFLSHDVRG